MSVRVAAVFNDLFEPIKNFVKKQAKSSDGHFDLGKAEIRDDSLFGLGLKEATFGLVLVSFFFGGIHVVEGVAAKEDSLLGSEFA